MAYEERRVVATDAVEPVDTVAPVTATPVAATPAVETVQAQPTTVVERRPQRTVIAEDPVDNVFAATQLIQTIIWAVVVIVLLVVALMALHVYAHLF
jgi:hypothetical protein